MGEHNLRGELTEPPADLTQEQAEKLNNPSPLMERMFERERDRTLILFTVAVIENVCQ